MGADQFTPRGTPRTGVKGPYTRFRCTRTGRYLTLASVLDRDALVVDHGGCLWALASLVMPALFLVACGVAS